MRWLRFLAMVLVLWSTGCSYLIASRGTNIDRLYTREEVEAALGKPTHVGEQDGMTFEEYETRRKIVEPGFLGATNIPMALGFSWGLAEFFLFPEQVWKVSKRTLLGQEIRFIYNQQGKVEQVLFDGDPIKFKSAADDNSIPPEIPVRGIDQSGGQDRD